MNKRRRYKAKARRAAKPQPLKVLWYSKAFEFVWPMAPAVPFTLVDGVGYFSGASPQAAGAGQTGSTIATDGWTT